MKKFKVGNVLRLSESNDFASEAGDIIKIVGVLSQPTASCEYITIRGCKGRLGLFSITSEFASSLELLTKKEIGEAIRKWDADHEKKEPEYNEVKRHAKVGEKIKVVFSDFPDRYSVGDVLTVTEDFEGRPSERSKYFHENGAYDCVWAWNGKMEVTVYDFEYVVLDGYNPREKGKRVYSLEQIDEAKKITLRMINEVYFNGDEALLFSNADKKAYYAILIKNGTHCNFEMTSSPAESTTIIRSQVNSTFASTAKCSNNDEPNEWIGKCVALCKALHKPIPQFIMDGD